MEPGALGREWCALGGGHNVDSIFEYVGNSGARLKVVGVGGGGSNAVNTMVASGLKGVDFIVANTDAQALHHAKAATKLQLGSNLTQGLGAGANPEVGRNAALEDQGGIAESLGGVENIRPSRGHRPDEDHQTHLLVGKLLGDLHAPLAQEHVIGRFEVVKRRVLARMGHLPDDDLGRVAALDPSSGPQAVREGGGGDIHDDALRLIGRAVPPAAPTR